MTIVPINANRKPSGANMTDAPMTAGIKASRTRQLGLNADVGVGWPTCWLSKPTIFAVALVGIPQRLSHLLSNVNRG